MAFRPYKKPGLTRSDARRGCDECDVKHEPFSCFNRSGVSDEYAYDPEFTEHCFGSGNEEEAYLESEEDVEEDVEEAERTYFFSLMDSWYENRRETHKAAKMLTELPVLKK